MPHNEAMKVVYQFLSLPTHIQASIANGLGLISPEDSSLSIDGQRVRWFRRARENGKLEELATQLKRRT